MRAIHVVVRSLGWVAALLLVAITLITVLHVVRRYFGFGGIIWSLEFSEYALLVLAFASASWALHEDGHVRITLLDSRLPPRIHAVVRKAGEIVSLGAVAFLLIGALMRALAAFQRGSYFHGTIRVREDIVFIAVAIPLAAICIQLLALIVSRSKGGE